jgi:uncharacterized PurR-regulated membrane protein YhhQ (DUF165 family)
VSIFEAGVNAGQGAGRFAVNVADAEYRIGRASEYAERSRPEEPGFFKRLGKALGAFARLVVPMLLLATLGGASFVYAGTPAWELPAPSWMNVGLFVLPLTFLAVHLTSRRYGAGYAFAQVLLTYIAGIALAVFGRDLLTMALGPQHVSLREITGFAAGLFVAQMIAIFVFDSLRGPQWYQAPLFASLFGGIALCLVAFPVSYAGTGIDWTGRMMDYMAVTSIAALLLVIPYWILRPLVTPRPGYGGY